MAQSDSEETEEGGTMQCNTCGTTFPASDTEEAANHSGHDVVHIDPGG